MQIFVNEKNLIFFQNHESSQKEEFGYQTASGEVAILVKKSFDQYEIRIDERYCQKLSPT